MQSAKVKSGFITKGPEGYISMSLIWHATQSAMVPAVEIPEDTVQRQEELEKEIDKALAS